MVDQIAIDNFFKAEAFAVAGASKDRRKYGNKVLRAYKQNSKKVYPINAAEADIEGISCVKSIAELPSDATSLSIITPPPITEKIVDEAIAKGIKNIWMQPGAESQAAIDKCRKHHINVIGDGSCVLLAMHFHEDYTETY